ncbi:MAG TPA: hypothetical protein VM689_09965 [Aliidongia sp.]|nr:hypothetical protein [Aliidongia sp.]
MSYGTIGRPESPGRRRAAAILTGLALFVAAPVGADEPNGPHLPPPPRYTGGKTPDAPLACQPRAADDIPGRLQCVEEELARLHSQLDRIEQIDERLAHTLDRLAEQDRQGR